MERTLTDEQRDALRGIHLRLSEAMIAIRDLQRRDCSLAARRELALAVTGVQGVWGWILFAEWALAGLDGLPEVERPWGPAGEGVEQRRREALERALDAGSLEEMARRVREALA